MPCYKRRLSFILLFCSNFLISNGNENAKENKDYLTNVLENSTITLICLGLKSQVNIPVKKYIAAEFLERVIVHNDLVNRIAPDVDKNHYSSLITKIVSQCITSPFIPKKEKKDNKEIYKYETNFDPAFLGIAAIQITIREVVLEGLTCYTNHLTKKLKLKLPPEIKENKMLYQGGKFILNSLIRSWTDQKITKLYKKIK